MSQLPKTAPIADLLRPVDPLRCRAYDATVVVAGAVLVALCAQIKVPIWPVPITGQTFAVLIVGGMLGARRGMAALGLYLAAGFALQPTFGLPVFASGGPAVLGYLAAFPLAAWIVGRATDRGWDARPDRRVLAMVAATATILVCGALWLAALAALAVPIGPGGRTIALGGVLDAGVVRFLPGAAVKIALAAALLPVARRLSGPRGRSRA